MLPYGKQSIDEDDIAAVAQVLRSDFLTTGPKVEEFEAALCQHTGAQHAVVCGNGTQALHLSALALGLGPGDAVIVPSLTFLATANAALYCGAEVVFADVDPQTGLMGAEHAEDALKRCGDLTPRAIFPVHLAGQAVNLPELRNFADEHGLKIVADSCHALGGDAHGASIGAGQHEDMATFSFHPVKTIAMGEGGAITTNNKDYADHMRVLRSHAMTKNPDAGSWVYDMAELGYNYRASDIHCALGVSQLKKLKAFVEKRRELASLYDELLKPLAPVIQGPQRISQCNPAWHLYAARIDFEALGKSRQDVMEGLRAQGVGTQVHYRPVHTQPFYTDRYGDLSLPGAQMYYERTLSLPLYPAMEEADVRHVVDALEKIAK